MLFPGKYWSAYWRLIKVSAGLAAIGALAWGALTSLGLYQGYAELVLATVIFAPVGMVFLLHGIGVFYAVILRLQSTVRSNSEPSHVATVGSVAFIALVFLLSGFFFTSLSIKAILAIVAR